MSKIHLARRWALAGFALLALNAALSTPANAAQNKLFKLFTMYSSGTTPRELEPYSLLRNGVEVEGGITDRQGRIYTAYHHSGEAEDWLIRFVFQEEALRIDANGKVQVSTFYTSGSSADDLYDDAGMACGGDEDCKQRPFLWFELYGRDTIFAHEPWWAVAAGKVIASGSTTDSGLLFVRRDTKNLRDPIRLLFCDGAAFDISANAKGRLQAVQVDRADSSIAGGTMTAQCATRTKGLVSYAKRPNEFNYGRPFLHLGLSYGDTPPEKQFAHDQEQAAEEQEEKARKALHKAEIALETTAYQQGKTHFGSQTGVTPVGRCRDDLLGTFAVVANPPTRAIVAYAHQFLAPSYQPGKPAFTLAKKADGDYRTGAISGQSFAIDIESADDSDPERCEVRFDQVFKLVRVDHTTLANKELEETIKGYGDIWEIKPDIADLKNVHYLGVITPPDPTGGGFGGLFFLPMERLSTP